MARTTAERQQEFRKRVNASAMAALETELAAALEREERLEAQLEQATARHSGTCRECGTALACPQCQGGEYA
jgi:hypothetical protein